MSINTNMYKSCNLCPHNCMADRLNGQSGFCNTGSSYSIASICAHKGEEPVISGEMGICNVFFYHCNMQCLYCQNYQISKNCVKINLHYTEENAVKEVCKILESGCHALGFVSPSHCIVQMIDIIKKVNKNGYLSTGFCCQKTIC